jgi:mono/diheme cytochrome c family protein
VNLRAKVVLLGSVGLGLLATGCKSVSPAEPLGSLNAQQTHGHAVFQQRCGVCHYDRQTGSLHGPSLLGMYRKPSLPSGAPANDDRVTDTILHGRGLMPAMGNTMDQQEMDDLMAYLHTL